MMHNTISKDATTTYFEVDFEVEMKKVIPHHKIDGPCKECLVKVMCRIFCNDLIKFFTKNTYVSQRQMLNYFHKKNIEQQGLK